MLTGSREDLSDLCSPNMMSIKNSTKRKCTRWSKELRTGSAPLFIVNGHQLQCRWQSSFFSLASYWSKGKSLVHPALIRHKSNEPYRRLHNLGHWYRSKEAIRFIFIVAKQSDLRFYFPPCVFFLVLTHDFSVPKFCLLVLVFIWLFRDYSVVSHWIWGTVRTVSDSWDNIMCRYFFLLDCCAQNSYAREGRKKPPLLSVHFICMLRLKIATFAGCFKMSANWDVFSNFLGLWLLLALQIIKAHKNNYWLSSTI